MEQIQQNSGTSSSYLCLAGHQIKSKDGYCKDCAICAVCQKPLEARDYAFALRTARLYNQEPNFTHSHCFTAVEKQQLTDETTEIPKYVFDKLNELRMICLPNESYDYNQTTHQEDARLRIDAWLNNRPGALPFITDFSKSRSADEFNEYIYMMAVKMRAAADSLELALGSKKRDVEIKKGLRDKQNFQDQQPKHKHRQPTDTRQPGQQARPSVPDFGGSKEKQKIYKNYRRLAFSHEDALALVNEISAKKASG